MSNRHGIVDTIIDSLAPVNRDGHKFIAIAAGLALIFFLVWPPLAWVLVIAALYIAYFFRDPDRVTPLREGLIIAPADGRIAAIESVVPPTETGLGPESRVRISTFLSVLDVHITRAPVAGRIVRSIYIPGAFLVLAICPAPVPYLDHHQLRRARRSGSVEVRSASTVSPPLASCPTATSACLPGGR